MRITKELIDKHASNLPKARVAILKAALDIEKPYRTIMMELGIKARGTVKSRLHRARAQIAALEKRAAQ